MLKEYLSREEMLELPICTKSYIILRDYIFHHADLALYRKMIIEYLAEMPVYELLQILQFASIMTGDKYQGIVDLIFRHYDRGGEENLYHLFD